MGRYLSAYLCSSAANETLRSFCKIRYLMILLRRCPRLPEASLCLRTHRAPPPAVSHSLLFTRKSAVPNRIRSVRFYSSAGRNAVKAEAPVGIVEEARSDLTTVGGRLGQSFSRLSAHINFYFKRKDMAAVVVPPVHPGRPVTQLSREDKDRDETSEPASWSRGKPDLQLFHISSLATAFGQSYGYVANHINATFSRTFSRAPGETTVGQVPPPTRTPRKLKRRKQPHGVAGSEGLGRGQVDLDADQGPPGSADRPSGGWEEGYRLFARHINRYFGAKVADERDQPAGERLPSAASQRKQEEAATAAPPRGLFHHSRHATDFGENYFQTAGHINQYFQGERGAGEDADAGLMETDSGSVPLQKAVSLMDCLRHPASAIPDLLGSYFSTGAAKQPPAGTSAQTVPKKKVSFLSRP